MKSSITKDFRKRFDQLSIAAQEQAIRAYEFWRSSPYHPSLQFKRVSSGQPIYSVRIGLGFRALGLWTDDQIFWFWIGPHAEYDDLLKRL